MCDMLAALPFCPFHHFTMQLYSNNLDSAYSTTQAITVYRQEALFSIYMDLVCCICVCSLDVECSKSAILNKY